MSDKSFLSLVPEGSPHRVKGERTVILPGVSLEILTTRRIDLETWELKGLNDPFWRFYIPTAGEATLITENATTHLRPNQGYIISPRTTMSSRIDAPFSKWYVHFTLGPTGDRAVPGVFPVDLNERMLETLQTLRGAPSGIPWISASLVGEALAQVPTEVWSRRQVDARVERAMAFMHANLNRKLTSEDVARSSAVSVRNLSHLFSQQVKISPMRVLLDFRLDKACRMLRHTDEAIEQIAEDCGFPNRYYLSRMLKQHRGTSPAVYRRGNLETS